MPSSVELAYHHLTAYGRFSLANLDAESVSMIKIEAPEDVYLAGKWDYFVADGSFVVREGNGSNTISLTTANTTDIWFACAPVDVSNKTLTLTVTTDKGDFVKELTFPANRKFEAGRIAKFTVDMAGVEVEQPEGTETEWVATSFADLKAGDQVVIVSTKGTSIYAMTNNNGTSKAPDASAVTYADNKLITNPTDDVIWTVNVDGENRIFHPNGDTAKWLYCTETNNGVRVGTNANKTFVLDAASNFMKHVGTERYLGVYNNQDWRCYTTTSGNISGQTFQFFVKADDGSEEPEQPKTLVSIAVSGQTTSYIVGDTFEFDGTVTATYDDGTTASVEPAEVSSPDMTTTGAKEVTVSYTEGEVTADTKYEITVNEAPADTIVVTVEEFLDAEVNATVLYQLTGTITNIANTTYGNFTIKDATASVYIYGLTRTPQSSNDKTFASLGLKVGDEVTLVTVRGEHNETAQGGGQNTPAYYVSHVSACATPVITCADNTVTITAESGATIYYTTNGDVPTESSSKYTAAFQITENTTVKAIAVATGKAKSAVAEKACTYVDPNAGGETEGVVVLSEQFDNSTTADSSNAISTSKFSNFSGTTDKAYTSKYGGIKLGSSKAAGYITSKSLDLSSAFTVQIDACKYGSDTGNITITVGSVTQTIYNSELGAAGSFKTFTLSFDAATATSTVKIATSSKRAYIDNVVITRY